MDEIPVVDISLISTKNGRIPSEEDWEVISKEVDKVLAGIGFVYLKNHDVSEESVCHFQISNSFAKSKEFFELDEVTKRKYLKKPHCLFGYVEANQEMLAPGAEYSAELRESFNCDRNKMERIRQSDDLIKEVPGLITAITTLTDECHVLIRKLHNVLARALQLDDLEYFNKLSKGFYDSRVPNTTLLRTIYYPPIPEEVTEGAIRCAPHTDYLTITLLFQDQMGGLEALNASGDWIAATPIPGTILVNTGDLLSFWSGGRYPATIHRVLVPEIETKKRLSRQSIAYFIGPDNDVMVSPLVGQGSNQEPVSTYDHVKRKLDNTYKF